MICYRCFSFWYILDGSWLVLNSTWCLFLVGIMGLQWAKHLRNAVKVTINDINEACVKMIKENCHLNHIRVEGGRTPRQLEGTADPDTPIASVEVTKMDANVIMHLRAFDYM